MTGCQEQTRRGFDLITMWHETINICQQKRAIVVEIWWTHCILCDLLDLTQYIYNLIDDVYHPKLTLPTLSSQASRITFKGTLQNAIVVVWFFFSKKFSKCRMWLICDTVHREFNYPNFGRIECYSVLLLFCSQALVTRTCFIIQELFLCYTGSVDNRNQSKKINFNQI